MRKTVIKEQPTEVKEAWDTILKNGIPIYVPVEYVDYPAADIPQWDHVILHPVYIGEK